MIKRLTHLALFYTAIFGTALLLQSCCNESIKIVGNGTMEIFDNTSNDLGEITGPFVVYAYPETVISDVAPLGLMNSAYATSCDYAYDNSILPETVTLICDKSFEFGDVTIAAGTNLLELEGVDAPSISNFNQNSETLITFTDIFIDKAVMEEAEYTFTINMSTDDGLDIVNSATEFFRL